VPALLPRLIASAAAREFLFRTVSQVEINYRGRPLSAGVAGRVHGGDRLPWVEAAGGDNYQPLRAARWQVHVYGAAAATLSAWCARVRLPLESFAFSPAHAAAGLRRDALYLLRPDGYVALASPRQDPERLVRYFASRGLRPPEA